MQEERTDMARRALLTEGERAAIQNPETRDNPYVAVSRVRKKVEDELPRDVEILEKHHPELLQELRAVVCEED
jgi:broad-specificity NMP kinase